MVSLAQRRAQLRNWAANRRKVWHKPAPHTRRARLYSYWQRASRKQGLRMENLCHYSRCVAYGLLYLVRDTIWRGATAGPRVRGHRLSVIAIVVAIAAIAAPLWTFRDNWRVIALGAAGAVVLVAGAYAFAFWLALIFEEHHNHRVFHVLAGRAGLVLVVVLTVLGLPVVVALAAVVLALGLAVLIIAGIVKGMEVLFKDWEIHWRVIDGVYWFMNLHFSRLTWLRPWTVGGVAALSWLEYRYIPVRWATVGVLVGAAIVIPIILLVRHTVRTIRVNRVAQAARAEIAARELEQRHREIVTQLFADSEFLDWLWSLQSQAHLMAVGMDGFISNCLEYGLDRQSETTLYLSAFELDQLMRVVRAYRHRGDHPSTLVVVVPKRRARAVGRSLARAAMWCLRWFIVKPAVGIWRLLVLVWEFIVAVKVAGLCPILADPEPPTPVETTQTV